MSWKRILYTGIFPFLMGIIFYFGWKISYKGDEILINVQEGLVVEMMATGYAIGPPYSTITKNGQPVVNKGFMTIGDVDVFTVAADPKVLSMGSIVYIDSLGIGLVHDTGKKIKGMKIDICFRTMDIAMEFGKKPVKVMILRKGN